MLDKVINYFFNYRKKSNCITVLNNRELSENYFAIKKTIANSKEKTCLSEYFSNCNGLNMFERLRFNNDVIKARGQR
jgi:hypothetical protein